jgi:hypothetical protein
MKTPSAPFEALQRTPAGAAARERPVQGERPATGIEQSPRMLAQRRAIDAAFGPPVQRRIGVKQDEPLRAPQTPTTLSLPVQRHVVVSDQNQGEESRLTELDAFLAQIGDPWMQEIKDSASILLSVNLEPMVETRADAAYEGRTSVTRIDTQKIGALTGTLSQWHGLLSGASTASISVNLLPREDQETGALMGVLLHELILHAKPMADAVIALRGSQHDAAANANIMEVLDSGHSNPDRWQAYFDKASQMGRALIDKGETLDGVELVLSMTDDLMTHLNPARIGQADDPAAQMDGTRRTELFEAADALGAEMVEVQNLHPDIW